MTAIWDSSSRQHLGDDLAHAQAGRLLDALHERHHDRLGVEVRRRRPSGSRAATGSAPRRRPARRRRARGRGGSSRAGRAGRFMPGEVVAVALGLLDLARELGPARPDDDVGAAVGEDLRERRAPAARAEHGDALAGGLPRGCPSHRVDPSPSGRAPAGSQRSAGAGSPRSSASSAAIASMSSPVAFSSDRLVERLAAVGAEVERLADDDVDGLAGEEAELLAVAGSSACVPQCAAGMIGMSRSSAIRTAPVLPRIGHRSGSRVSEPSG